MDAARFDAWVGGIARSRSRRSILGGAAALAAFRARRPTAAAACKAVGKRCKTDDACCTKRCKKKRCAPKPGFFACGSGDCRIGKGCFLQPNGGGACGACPADPCAGEGVGCGPNCSCRKRPDGGNVCGRSFVGVDCADDDDCDPGWACGLTCAGQTGCVEKCG